MKEATSVAFRSTEDPFWSPLSSKTFPERVSPAWIKLVNTAAGQLSRLRADVVASISSRRRGRA
jgi:hypothetical protein